MIAEVGGAYGSTHARAIITDDYPDYKLIIFGDPDVATDTPYFEFYNIGSDWNEQNRLGYAPNQPYEISTTQLDDMGGNVRAAYDACLAVDLRSGVATVINLLHSLWFRELALATVVALKCSLQASTLEISFKHLIGDKLIRHNSLRYQNSSAESTITRLSYLVSGFALQSVDGQWIDLEDTIAWIDSIHSRTRYRLDSIPSNKYQKLAFYVGVHSSLNHMDPAQFPADHPLNPNLNNLHWNWEGGYIFMALEGHWRVKEQSAVEGYAYHYATDAMYTRVGLPIQHDLNEDSQITIGLELDHILDGLSFEKDGSTTHSAKGDPVSMRIKQNLSSAFRVLEVNEKARSAFWNKTDAYRSTCEAYCLSY